MSTGAQTGAPFAASASQEVLLAAASSVDITPSGEVFLAGYGSNRRSRAVHDSLKARCLVLASGDECVAFLACDLLGLSRLDVLRIRSMVTGVAPDNVFVSATHTHSGPDTLGQWGPEPGTSGVDFEWKTGILAQMADLVNGATADLQPVRLRVASSDAGPGLSRNIRIPENLDTDLSVFHLETRSGVPMATLVNFACHPEVLNTHSVTADFPHWLYNIVEGSLGGTCLFINGALGGMVTADYDESTAPPGENWAAAERIGTTLGEKVCALVADAPTLDAAPISVRNRILRVPLENEGYRALVRCGVFPRDLLKRGCVETEVNRILIGPAEFVTVPGEALPSVGLYIKRHMKGRSRFLLGLTCDELGYILSREDYGLSLYAYETSASVGSTIGAQIVDAILSLVR